MAVLRSRLCLLLAACCWVACASLLRVRGLTGGEIRRKSGPLAHEGPVGGSFRKRAVSDSEHGWAWRDPRHSHTRPCLPRSLLPGRDALAGVSPAERAPADPPALDEVANPAALSLLR